MNKLKTAPLFFAICLFFTTLSVHSGKFSDFYYEDENGLHIKFYGVTPTNNLWILREYRPQDFDAHWRIINENMSTPESLKQYRAVSAADKESVKKRRNRSLDRFAKGNPWGIMSLLNEDDQCVFVFGLGRRTGKEGPARWGHGHIGLTEDPQKAKKRYRKSFLATLTQHLAPEIRRLGENEDVAEQIRHNFSHDINPEDEQGIYIETGPLTHIDATYSPEQVSAWKELVAAGFKYDTEDSMDWREKTIHLQSSTFKTLEENVLDQFQGELVEYQRYHITGPEGKDVVVWYSPKWGGIKLCFVYEIPKSKPVH